MRVARQFIAWEMAKHDPSRRNGVIQGARFCSPSKASKTVTGHRQFRRERLRKRSTLLDMDVERARDGLSHPAR